MKPMPYRLFICGKREVDGYAGFGVTHILSLEDPGTPKKTPSWFQGIHEQLHFNDVENAAESAVVQGAMPSLEHVRRIVRFGERCLAASDSAEPATVLVHCFAGVSRSPAAAFVLASQAFGKGLEKEALELVLGIRPGAIPNSLVVRHADELLGADGALIRALAPMKDLLRRQLDDWIGSQPAK